MNCVAILIGFTWTYLNPLNHLSANLYVHMMAQIAPCAGLRLRRMYRSWGSNGTSALAEECKGGGTGGPHLADGMGTPSSLEA